MSRDRESYNPDDNTETSPEEAAFGVEPVLEAEPERHADNIAHDPYLEKIGSEDTIATDISPLENARPASRPFANRLKSNGATYTFSTQNTQGHFIPVGVPEDTLSIPQSLKNDNTIPTPTNIVGGKFGEEISTKKPKLSEIDTTRATELEQLDNQAAALAKAFVLQKQLGKVLAQFARLDERVNNFSEGYIPPEIESLRQQIQEILPADDAPMTYINERLIMTLEKLLENFDAKITDLSSPTDPIQQEAPTVEAADTVEQDEFAPVTLVEEQSQYEQLDTFNEGQIYQTSAQNVRRDPRTNQFLITRVFSEQSGWTNIPPVKLSTYIHPAKLNKTLEEYTRFITAVQPQDHVLYKQLINAKMDVIDALELGNFSQVENYVNALINKIAEARSIFDEKSKHVPAQTKKVLRTKLSSKKPLDEDDAARSSDDYQASLTTEDENDDARRQQALQQTPSQGGSGNVTPPTPPSGPPLPPPPVDPQESLSPDDGMDSTPLPPILPMSLDGVVKIVSTQPGQKNAGDKTLNGVYINNKGVWTLITENEEYWRGVISMFNGASGVEGFYMNYISFFESGSRDERKEKLAKHEDIIVQENKLVRLIKNKKIIEAYALCKMLKDELSKAQEEWKNTLPEMLLTEKRKVEQSKEQLEMKKKWEEEEKVHEKVVKQSEYLRSEVTTDIEQQHIARELAKLNQYYENAKAALEKPPVDGSVISAYVEARTLFQQTLNSYEEKINLLNQSIIDHSINGKKIISGSVLRPTRAANDDSMISRKDKNGITEKISVKSWQTEQTENKKTKIAEAESLEDTYINRLQTKHIDEYLQDPKAYVIKYRNREFPSGDVEKTVVQNILKDAPADILSAEEFKALDTEAKKSAYDPRVAHKRVSLGYSPAEEKKFLATEEGAAIQVQEKTERELVQNLSQEDLDRRMQTDGGLYRATGIGLTTRESSNTSPQATPNNSPTLKDYTLNVPGLGGASNAPGTKETKLSQPIIKEPIETTKEIPPAPTKSPEEIKKAQERMSDVGSMSKILSAFAAKQNRKWMGVFILAGTIVTATVVATTISNNRHKEEPVAGASGPEKSGGVIAEKASDIVRDVTPSNYEDSLLLEDGRKFFKTLEKLNADEILTKYISGFVKTDNPSSLKTLSEMSAYDIYYATDELPGVNNESRHQFSWLIKQIVGVLPIENAVGGKAPTSIAYPGKGETVAQFIDRTKKNVQHAKKGEPLEKAAGQAV